MIANEPVARKILDDWTRTVGEQFLRSVRPIYTAKRRGILDQAGSCVLMRLSGRRCVVTAAHISDFLDYSTLYIGGMKELVEINGDFLVTSRRKGRRRFDPYDFTVLPV